MARVVDEFKGTGDGIVKMLQVGRTGASIPPWDWLCGGGDDAPGAALVDVVVSGFEPLVGVGVVCTNDVDAPGSADDGAGGNGAGAAVVVPVDGGGSTNVAILPNAFGYGGSCL
ncbi:hypothetical protein AaE_002319 [Aphanomyces astaci]|uniref:Uncharacterized protein n=1 Tax=Aphanomyces astaci TaxID=112090 RepID=A0A6A5AUW0_APHAT|nr:hypothetical protein AaE_002319 [Aphanomyces astaci]